MDLKLNPISCYQFFFRFFFYHKINFKFTCLYKKNLFFYIKRYQEMGWKFLYQNSRFFKSKISFFYIKKSG